MTSLFTSKVEAAAATAIISTHQNNIEALSTVATAAAATNSDRRGHGSGGSSGRQISSRNLGASSVLIGSFNVNSGGGINPFASISDARGSSSGGGKSSPSPLGAPGGRRGAPPRRNTTRAMVKGTDLEAVAEGSKPASPLRCGVQPLLIHRGARGTLPSRAGGP